MGPTRDDIARALHDRYEVGDEIGQGGMATVYRAIDRKSGAKVAIKVMRPDMTSPMATKRFAKEIRVTAQLQHPNILPVLDVGEVEGTAFYVMPFVDGESLHERLQRESQLGIHEAVALASELADALGHAHESLIMHRDIKPSNVLISHGHAMLSDFGIARVVDEHTADRITSTGIAVGTVHYMSPEQATTDRLDGRSDIYSLGCLLYEMLGGSPPFAGATAQGIMARHAVDPVPSLRTLRTTVPPSLEHAIVRALEKAPADRFSTMAEFKAAIQLSLTNPELPASTKLRFRVAVLVGVVVTLVAAASIVIKLVPNRIVLDDSRVMVFPLSVNYAAPDSGVLGENVATMIGSVLDGVGPLRWLDAWPLLATSARQMALTAQQAGDFARSRQSRYFVLGRVFEQSGNVTVSLDLFDAVGDSSLGKGLAEASGGDPVALARIAVNKLLPLIVKGVPLDVTRGWEARNPRAITSFLLAEAAFRRARFDEAHGHYRQAVEADSAFSLAAIRGAQAASWDHSPGEAALFIDAARRQPLAPRYAAFVRGYAHYLAGRADSAAGAFRAALAIDREMAVAWQQLGEVYQHLLPLAGDADSTALDAFNRALALDPTSTNVAFHLIEIGLRRGEAERSKTLARAFLAASPDSTLARQVEILMRCETLGPAKVDWEREASLRPVPLLLASLKTAAAGGRVDCAISGFRAILAIDTSNTDQADGRRWAANHALQGALLALGQSTAAVEAVDHFVGRWKYGTTLILLAAPYDSLHEARARAMLRDDRATYGENFERLTSTTRAWELGLLAVRIGDLDLAGRMAARLRAMSDSLRVISERDAARTSRMAGSVQAHIALANGDSARALALVRPLVAAAARGDEIVWDEAWPMGAERLMLARLLLARGNPAEAIQVANVLDSPAASIHPLYLRASLEVRLNAAVALRDRTLESRIRERIRRLQQTSGTLP